MKVIITGASGVLGSAVYSAFKEAGHEVLGLARTRPSNDLVKLDLLNYPETKATFSEFKPECKAVSLA